MSESDKSSGSERRVERRSGKDRRDSKNDRRGDDRVVTESKPRRQKPDRRRNSE